MVFSTPAMVETNNNIYIKKLDKVNSNNKKDKLFVDEVVFKEMQLNKVSEETLDYRNRASKIKVNEPLVIFPIYDRTIKDHNEKIQEGVEKLQTTLRNLTEEDVNNVTFRVSTGSEWFKVGEIENEKKKNFEHL